MLMLVGSLLDLVAGILMLIPGSFPDVIFYVAIFMLLKAFFSMINGVMDRSSLIILGIIDLFAGLLLLSNINIPFFWLVLLLKGSYNFINALFSK